MKSSLVGKIESAKSDEELFEIKRQAWLRNGDFVLMRHQLDKESSIHRIFIEAMANVIYGKRL